MTNIKKLLLKLVDTLETEKPFNFEVKNEGKQVKINFDGDSIIFYKNGTWELDELQDKGT